MNKTLENGVKMGWKYKNLDYLLNECIVCILNGNSE